MGASQSTARPKSGSEDNFNLEYLEFKIQEKLTSVDETVTKLMKAVDVVHGTAKVLDDYLRLELVDNDESTCLDTMKKNLNSCKQNAFTLLFAVEESLTSQQTESIRIMSDFLHFAANELYSHCIIPKDVSFSKELDAYRDTKQGEEIQKDERLQKLHTLQAKNEEMKNYINILKEKELTFLNAERNFRAEIYQYKKEIQMLKEDNDKNSKLIESNVFSKSDNLIGLNQSLQQEIQTHTSEHGHSEQKKSSESLATGISRIQKNVDITNGQNYNLRPRKAESNEKKSLRADKIEIKSQNVMFEADYKAKCSSWAENINDLKKDIENLKNEKKSLSEKNETLEQKCLKSEKEIEKLKQSISEMQEKIDKAETDISNKQQALMQADKEKQDIIHKLDDEKRRQTSLKSKDTVIYDLKTELQQRERQREKLTKHIKQLQTDNEALKENNNKLSEEIKQLHTDNEALKEKNTKLCEEINNFQEDYKKLLTKINDHETSLRKYENYKRELDILKAKKCVQVQLYSSNRGDMMSGVENELKEMLKTTLESEQIQVEFIQCARQSEILPDVPVLLLCITASRLGTDVANVTQGLAITPKMALLIFHHKDIHALPSQASERVLTGAELHALGGIFDMAFLTGKGFHNCQMNKNNCISLINFIKREGHKKIYIN